MHPVAGGGVGWTGLSAAFPGKLLVGAGDGTINLFDFNLQVCGSERLPIAHYTHAAATDSHL